MGLEATVDFVIVCFFATCFLTQGIALSYSGIAPYNNLLTQSIYSILCASICSLQFLVVGATLACMSNYTPAIGPFVGSLRDVLLLKMPTDNVEDLTFYLSDRLLTLAFSVVSATIMIGATSQRGRFVPSLVFLVLWLTLVYDPIAYWCWNKQGWSYRLGAIDYAGGTAVHCTAGFTALVYAWHLGPRSESTRQSQPSSFLLVVFGTFLMWCGWSGFNTGSAMRPGYRALHALLNTQISASAGGLTWLILDHSFDGTWSLIGFCSGIISGLVCVTPAAAVIPPWSALIFGTLGGITCNLGTKLKFFLGVDDALDIFAVHGVAGFLGSILTGVFAQGGIWGKTPGLIKGNPKQVVYQITSASAIVVYTCAVSHILLSIIGRYMKLQIDPELEMVGLDLSEHGEVAFSGTEGFNSSGPATIMSRSDNQFNRYKQTNVNVSMFPDPSETPLLKIGHPPNYSVYMGG